MSGSLTIVGLGPGRPQLVTLEAADLLRRAVRDTRARVYAFSSAAPIARALAPDLAIESLDALLCDPGADRSKAYQTLVKHLVTEAFRDEKNVYYLVPGNPLMINDLVIVLRRTCRMYDKPVRIVHGLSFVDVVLDRVFWRADPGLRMISAAAIARGDDVTSPAMPSLVYELGEMAGGEGDRRLVSEAGDMIEALATRLLETFPPEHPVALLFSGGPPNHASLAKGFPLSELTRQVIPTMSNLWVPALGGAAMESDVIGIEPE